MQRRRWDGENGICCSSTLIASHPPAKCPREREREREGLEGEINLIRIRKQTKHVEKISHTGGKSERNMWQDSGRHVSPLLNVVTGLPEARCWAGVSVAPRCEARGVPMAMIFTCRTYGQRVAGSSHFFFPVVRQPNMVAERAVFLHLGGGDEKLDYKFWQNSFVPQLQCVFLLQDRSNCHTP